MLAGFGLTFPPKPAPGPKLGFGYTRNGRDIQRFAEGITGSAVSQADLCHGDFDGTISLDMGDVSGFVEALLTD